MYRRAQVEVFARFGECSRWDGLVQRVTTYADDARTVPIEVRWGAATVVLSAAAFTARMGACLRYAPGTSLPEWDCSSCQQQSDLPPHLISSPPNRSTSCLSAARTSCWSAARCSRTRSWCAGRRGRPSGFRTTENRTLPACSAHGPCSAAAKLFETASPPLRKPCCHKPAVLPNPAPPALNPRPQNPSCALRSALPPAACSTSATSPPRAASAAP